MPKLIQTLLLALLLGTLSAQACDLCACYNKPLHPTPAISAERAQLAMFYAGISEQFTSFGTARFNGDEVANPTGEYLNSSISQLFLGSSFFDDRLALQANIPLIYRDYRRSAGFDIEHGTISGLGDISLTANFIILRKEGLYREVPSAGLSKDSKTVLPGNPEFTATIGLMAGIKLPTGDFGELGVEEVEVEGAPISGIGGHDLTLGTGSVDGIFGVQTFVRYRSLFFQADAQYAWRGMGAYSYRYANDLTWSGGPGMYLLQSPGKTLGVQLVLSGETKGYDEQNKEVHAETGISSLYLGPRVLGTFGRLSGELGVDLPVVMNTTGYQITPDYRIRAGVTYRF